MGTVLNWKYILGFFVLGDVSDEKDVGEFKDY